jgi:hypothetical protein
MRSWVQMILSKGAGVQCFRSMMILELIKILLQIHLRDFKELVYMWNILREVESYPNAGVKVWYSIECVEM